MTEWLLNGLVGVCVLWACSYVGRMLWRWVNGFRSAGVAASQMACGGCQGCAQPQSCGSAGQPPTHSSPVALQVVLPPQSRKP